MGAHDFSDVLVHVFYEPVRRFYDLDGLWAGAKVVELPEPYATLAAQFTSEGDPPDPWPAAGGGSGPGYFGKPVR